MKLQPLGDRVIVRPLKAEEITKGGIVLPDTAKEKPYEGEIIAAGKGRIRDDGSVKALDVKVGDRVLYSKYGGNEIKMHDNGEEVLIMHESDILAIVK
ncbi:MAG: co-chaperone GroES [Candidatus Omnitrophica bacterium]|nr:co-chaperone GroES [Candidatus Omnitrophota bacterium]